MKFLTKINVFTPGKLFWVGTMLATKQIIKIVDPNTEYKTAGIKKEVQESWKKFKYYIVLLHTE